MLLIPAVDSDADFTLNMQVYMDLYYQQYQIANNHVIPGAVYLELLLEISSDQHITAQLPVMCVNKFIVNHIPFFSKQFVGDYTANFNHANSPGQYHIDVARSENGLAIIEREFELHFRKNIPQQHIINISLDHRFELLDLYLQLADHGITFGDAFQLFTNFTYANNIAATELINDSNTINNNFIIPPEQIYSAFQLLTYYLAMKAIELNTLCLPSGMQAIYFECAPTQIKKIMILLDNSCKPSHADLLLFDQHEKLIACMEKFQIIQMDYVEFARHLEQFIPTISHPAAKCIAQQAQLNLSKLLNNDYVNSLQHLSLVASLIYCWATKALH